ncbi:Hexadecenal dehydrogenase [Ciborinia camelliae]|nr:Hexadecenal dehydrogenase [Ciborinia camelliae]
MSSVKIAPFEHSSLESIPTTVKLLRSTFRSQKTKPLEYRLKQLRKLYWAIDDNSDALIEACKIDLGKPAFETSLTEIDWMKNDIIFVCKNLKRWMKDEPAPDTALTNTVFSPRIRKEPLGMALVIGAFNFPIQLSLGPFVGAICAGCTAVLKPSEQAPKTAMVLKKIIESSLDPDAYVVVNGAIPETTALLNEKWDKIFYTGGATVGTIIAKKAAETLTPVALELGGRNPAIVSKNADPVLAARRLLWGKVLNAGQVCIAQNYVMVEKEILDVFIEQLKIAYKEFFPKGTKASPDFGRIVNNRQFLRIKKMLDDSKGKILIGGEMDEAENYIALTVVLVDSKDDSMLADESFGPLVPILPVNDLDEAINIAHDIHSTPLGFYPFGTKEETEKLLSNITSGGATVNDSFFHGSIPTLAFGGVGDSGTGSYRGEQSFYAFTHRRSVATTPSWIERMLNVRYPPYSDAKLAEFRRSRASKPNFDREGNEVRGLGYWLGIVMSLGGEGIKGVLLRWAVLAFFVYGSKRIWDAKFGSGLPSYLR